MRLKSTAIRPCETLQTNRKNHLEVFETICKTAVLAATSRDWMKRLIIALLLLPTALWAEDDLVNRYGPLLTQCYAAAGTTEAKAECIGILSQNCMGREEGGETTLGMTQCLSSETEVWDVFLNDEYRQTMAWAKAMDTDEAEVFPEFANRAKSLRDAQRAWLVFRDAECGLDYAIFGSGSMRQIVGASCFMRMTAERTIDLREKRSFPE